MRRQIDGAQQKTIILVIVHIARCPNDETRFGHVIFVRFRPRVSTIILAILIPIDGPPIVTPEKPPEFEPDSTQTFQAKMPRAPVWVSSMVAGNSREKTRLHSELGQIKGALRLLMKQRNGGTWTPQERVELKQMLRSLSSVSPYLLVWAVPGSILILPFLAWHMDTRRKRRSRAAAKP